MSLKVSTMKYWEILKPSDALAEAARLNREAIEVLGGDHPEQAAVLAEVVQALAAYVAASRWTA
jgi:hypothetical protein